LALFLKVCGNRFSCHVRSVARLGRPKLINFDQDRKKSRQANRDANRAGVAPEHRQHARN